MIKNEEIKKYVEENIGTFHKKRIESLNKLKLVKILKRKNPYLYKAKYVQTATEIVSGIVDAHISSSEEGIFGDWLEGLAIHINSHSFKGWKSGIEGMDLEFDKDNIRYVVSIKSGPNWGNSTQHKKLKDYFKTAKKSLRTSNSGIIVKPVLGICYGRNKNIDQGNYDRYCGQDFWEFISGNKNLYKEIIEPLGFRAKQKTEEYDNEYSKKMNLFVKEFAEKYCNADGSINWEGIVEMNSKSYKE